MSGRGDNAAQKWSLHKSVLEFPQIQGLGDFVLVCFDCSGELETLNSQTIENTLQLLINTNSTLRRSIGDGIDNAAQKSNLEKSVFEFPQSQDLRKCVLVYVNFSD